MLFASGIGAVAQEGTGSGWYRSNAMGMPLESISEESREEYEYTLFVDRSDTMGTRRVYRDGNVVRETEREFSPAGGVVFEEERVDDELTARREFDENGRLEVERAYEEGELDSVDFYAYRDDRLYERRREDNEANELFVERYSYKTDGSLRRVERTFSASEETRLSEFLFADGELREEWHERAGVSVLVRYDRFGRLVRTEERRNGSLSLSERLEYPADDESRDTAPERRERVEPGRDRRTVTTYDEDGRETLERRYEDDELAVEREFRYEDDLLTMELVRDEEGEQERRYQYDDGELSREEWTRDGTPEREIDYDGERRTEQRYVDGEPALIIEFDGEQRVREQVLRDGEVVREREF